MCVWTVLWGEGLFLPQFVSLTCLGGIHLEGLLLMSLFLEFLESSDRTLCIFWEHLETEKGDALNIEVVLTSLYHSFFLLSISTFREKLIFIPQKFTSKFFTLNCKSKNLTRIYFV